MAEAAKSEKPTALEIYHACRDIAEDSPEGLNKHFFQSDLENLFPCFGESKDTKKELVGVIQDLQNRYYFRIVKVGNQLAWAPRPQNVATQLQALDQETFLVYNTVEDAGTQGTWVKKIKERVGLAQNVVQKSITKLEKASLIKSIRSVKAPAQRMYMLAHLQASEDVTGGSFFDAGDLDESLVEELGNLIVWHVRQQSWNESKRKCKRERSASPRGDRDETDRRREREVTEYIQLAYPAGSHSYPDTTTIHEFLTKSSAIRSSKSSQFTTEEIQALIDVLVWDGKLEKVGGGYRSVRGVKVDQSSGGVDFGWQEDELKNGLTEAPCGRCTVADLCSADHSSRVNVKTCPYFPQWLDV